MLSPAPHSGVRTSIPSRPDDNYNAFRLPGRKAGSGSGFRAEVPYVRRQSCGVITSRTGRRHTHAPTGKIASQRGQREVEVSGRYMYSLTAMHVLEYTVADHEDVYIGRHGYRRWCIYMHTPRAL